MKLALKNITYDVVGKIHQDSVTDTLLTHTDTKNKTKKVLR